MILRHSWIRRVGKDTAEAYEKAERCEKAERDYNQLADETADEQKRLAEALARIATLEGERERVRGVLEDISENEEIRDAIFEALAILNKTNEK